MPELAARLRNHFLALVDLRHVLFGTALAVDRWRRMSIAGHHRLARETKRAIAGVEGKVKIYPGIDIDVPTRRTDKRTTPEDVRKAVRAAFDAGADGAVLSREYVEMWLANLSAAGETLREIFNKRPA